ncbi:MAG: hypothetical protein ABI190_09855 [Casimicrobiaceae bacterium]
MRSLLLSLLAIGVCGGLGGLAGWSLARALGITGVGAALCALPVAMAVATALWAGVVVLSKCWRQRS